MTTPPRLSRATFASTVGTALEWYDFSLYGTASALVFAHVFFPAGNELAGTLASLGTFAVGFFARPIGGVIIGLLGDRVGRRQIDRKSTRLNSSHVANSYAVFCLKNTRKNARDGELMAVAM